MCPASYLAAQNTTALYGIRLVDFVSVKTPRTADSHEWLDNKISELAMRYPDLRVRYTGYPELLSSMTPTLLRDLVVGDAISVPLAMVLVCLLLMSLRFGVFPVSSVVCSFGFAILLCLILTQITPVAELASNLMMVLAIAMSVDYNLFLLTRYREDLLAGHPVPDAVLHALLSSGYTIVVSGSTLMCCTTGLYLLPLDLIASLGLAGTISVFAAMLFNLTFVPAVLVYFPRFFAMGILGVEVEAALRNGGGRGTIQNDHGSRVGSGSDDDDVLLVLGPRTADVAETAVGATENNRSGIDTRVDCPSKSFAEVIFTHEHISAVDQCSDISHDDTDSTGISMGSGQPATDTLHPDAIITPDTTSEEVSNDSDQYDMASCRKSFWFRVGARILSTNARAWYAVRGVTALFLAFLYPAVTFQKAAGPLCFFPTGTAAFDNYVDFSGLFGAGRLTPYVVIIEAPNASTINLVNATFAAQKALVDIRVHGNAMVANGSLFDASPLFNSGNIGSYSTVCNQSCGMSALCVDAYLDWYFNATQQATFFEVSLDVSPWSPEGTAWLLQGRQALRMLEAQIPDVTCYIAGQAAFDHDLINFVYQGMHRMTAFVLILVFVFVGAAYGSVILALKVVFTIAGTLSIVFGLATVVYVLYCNLTPRWNKAHFAEKFVLHVEYGALNWTNLRCFRTSGGLCWIPPLLLLPILVGFGLDYHIFLLNRVVEFRRLGYSDKESISLGLGKTGQVITCAGLIMATAFFGILPAHTLLLSQLSFIVITAVLCDTFLVRGVMVPAMMGIFGGHNWWPLSMPHPHRRICS